MNNTFENVKKLKEDILNAAQLSFSKKGYKKTNFNDIATACDISRGPIYYHFKNKANLHLIVLLKLLKKYDKKMDNIVNSEDSFENKMLEILYIIFKNYRDICIWKEDIIVDAPKKSVDAYKEFISSQINKISKIIKSEYKNLNEDDVINLTNIFYLSYKGILFNLSDKTKILRKVEYEEMIKEIIYLSRIKKTPN